MSKTSYYFFSFLLLLLAVLVFEVVYIFVNKSYTAEDIAKKRELLKIARVCNLNTAIKNNLIESHR